MMMPDLGGEGNRDADDDDGESRGVVEVGE